MGVTDGSLRAVVPELLCAHLAALAAVRDEADPQRAAGRRRRTRARPLAELRARGRVLQRRRGPGHGRGGWGEALRGNGRGEGGGGFWQGFLSPEGLPSPSHLRGVQQVHIKVCFSTTLLIARQLSRL